MMLPHTPGRACAPGGTFSQRSGLDGIFGRTLAQGGTAENMDPQGEELRT